MVTWRTEKRGKMSLGYGQNKRTLAQIVETEFALTNFLERIIRVSTQCNSKVQHLQEINLEWIHIFSIFIGPQFNNISLVIPKNYSWELFWVYSNDFCSHNFSCRLMSWLAWFGYRKRGFTKSYALFFIRKFWYHFFVVSNYYFGIFFQFSGRKIVVVEIVWQRSTHT